MVAVGRRVVGGLSVGAAVGGGARVDPAGHDGAFAACLGAVELCDQERARRVARDDERASGVAYAGDADQRRVYIGLEVEPACVPAGAVTRDTAVGERPLYGTVASAGWSARI